MNGQAKQPDDEQQPEVELEEESAPAREHEPDCWRYSRCWCGYDEDQDLRRGER